MPDYKESQVTGTKWQRCRGVTVTNPYGGQPMAYFQEEEAVSIGDGTVITRDMGACNIPFSPAETFPLINPATGESVGTASHQDLYVLLHSLYIHTATQRDAAQASPDSP